MDWHTTGAREELILAMSGQIDVEVASRANGARRRRCPLPEGFGVFLGPHVSHRVVNRTAEAAMYVYVTAPAAAPATFMRQ